jgi:hypothetical protein
MREFFGKFNKKIFYRVFHNIKQSIKTANRVIRGLAHSLTKTTFIFKIS